MQTPSSRTAASRDDLWNKRRALLADHRVYLSLLYLQKENQITSDMVAFKLLVSSEGKSDVDVTRGLILCSEGEWVGQLAGRRFLNQGGASSWRAWSRVDAEGGFNDLQVSRYWRCMTGWLAAG